MIKDFKYFHWGIYPEKTPVYALYEPVTDRFLLLLDSFDRAVQLKHMVSRRFSLFVCRIDTAQDFKSSIIDNECCDNWSFVDVDRTLVTNDSVFNTALILVKEICESVTTDVWDMSQEKEWLLFCHWIMAWIDKTNAHGYSQAITVLAPILGLESTVKNPITIQAQQQILSRLYWGQLVAETEQQINDIIDLLCPGVAQL